MLSVVLAIAALSLVSNTSTAYTILCPGSGCVVTCPSYESCCVVGGYVGCAAPSSYCSSTYSCPASSSSPSTSVFSIVGYGGTTGSRSASYTLPSGANYYFCNGGDGNGALRSYTWSPDATSYSTYASAGNQGSNVCSDASDHSDIAVGGVAVDSSVPYTTESGAASGGTSSFNWAFSVSNPSDVVLSLSCGWFECSSITVPPGCTQLFYDNGGDSYETTYAAQCIDLSPGTYTVSGSLNGAGGYAVVAYIFTTTTTTSTSTSTTTVFSGGTPPTGGSSSGSGSGSGSSSATFGSGSIANLGAATNAICSVYTTIESVIFILGLTLMILGGVLYAGGHVLPGQQRGPVLGYGMGMILGGVIGVIIAMVAPYVLSIITGTSISAITSACSV
ncbi:MAG: hypothetical protein ACP5UH_00180 [Candidatus Micrarchaeia archaeon]